MGCAKYVGRVGALAVALGFGAAMATATPAIALADTTESDPNVGTNQPNENPDPPQNSPNGTDPDPTPSLSGGQQPASGGGNDEQQNNNQVSGQKPGDPEVRAVEPGEVLNTGGYQQDEKKEEKTPDPTGTTPPPPPPVVHIPETFEVVTPKDHLIPQVVLLEQGKSKSAELQQQPGNKLKTTLNPELSQEKKTKQEVNEAQLRIASLNANAEDLTTNSVVTAFSTTEDNNQQVMQTMAAPSALAPRPALTTVFTGFLALVGLGPSTGAGTPSLPFVPAPIFDAIFAFFRRVEATFSNETPRAKLSDPQYAQNGDMSGVIAVEDDFGDGHTFVVSQQGSNGTATVDEEGNVTYVRDAGAPAGPDTFVVTVSDDTGFHVHSPGAQHTTTVAVTVPGPVAAPDPADGRTTGQIPFTNTTGGPVTFTPTNDEKGEFEVAADGTWTFTPDPDTRHQAARELGGVTQKTYTVDIKDQQGNVIDTVEVTVPISGANDKPAFVPPSDNATPPKTDPDTGVITGSFQVKDEDLDDLDIEGTSTYGTVTILRQETNPETKVTTVYYQVTPPPAQPEQSFARMSLMAADEPTEQPNELGAMRMMALSEPAPESLSTMAAPPITINFIIRDGYGGNTPLTVTVPVDENGNPESTTIYSASNPDTGAIEITVDATDPDGDPLTYTATDPAKGTLVQTGPNTWVYTPSAQARHDAIAVDSTVQDRRDNFTITIDDGQGNSVDVPVTVSLDQGISPSAATTTTVLDGNYLGYVSSPDGKRLYIVNYADNSVKVVDTASNKVIDTVPTGEGSMPYTVALSPSGDRLYVSNLGTGTVTVIDTATNSVVGNPINVGGPSPSMVVSPDGTKLYVAGYDQTAGRGTVTVVDLTGQTPNQTVDTGTTTISRLIVSPDGTTLYGTGNTLAGERAAVTKIDLTTTQPTVTTLAGSTGSVDNKFSPDGTKLYVTNADGKVHIYDTATDTETATYDIGGSLYGISISPDGRQALVEDGTGTIHVIDTATGTQTGTIASGAAQQGLVEYTPNGAGAYLLNINTAGTSTLKYLTGNTVPNAAPTFTVAPVSTPADGPITYHISDIADTDSDQVTISVDQPAHGTVTIANGDYVYTPTGTRQADTITFTATDAHGGITTHTLQIPAATTQSDVSETADGLALGSTSLSPNEDRAVQLSYVPSTDPGAPGTTYVTTIDTSTGKAVSTTAVPMPGINQGEAPVFNSAGDVFFVKTFDEVNQKTYIAAVNAETGEVLNGGPIEVAGGQMGPMTLDGNRVYQTTSTSGAGPKAYVTIFDSDTGNVVGGSPLEITGYATNDLRLGPNDRGYLLLEDSSARTTSLVIINTADGTVVGAPIDIDGARNFSFVLYDDDASDVHRAYVTTGQNGVPGTTLVTIVNTETGATIGDSVEIEGNNDGVDVALNEDGTRAYQTTYVDNGSGPETIVTVIDTADGSHSELTRVPGVATFGSLVKGDHIYLTTLANGDDLTVSSINTETGALEGDVALDNANTFNPPTLTKSGDLVYTFATTQDDQGNTVARMAVFDAATGTAAPTVDLPGGANQVLDTGDRIIATASGYNDQKGKTTTQVAIIDGHTGQNLNTSPIEVDGVPASTVITVGDYASLATYDFATQEMHVAVIDLQSNELVSDESIAVLGFPPDDYYIGTRDDGSPYLVVSSLNPGDGTSQTSVATVNAVDGTVDVSSFDGHGKLVRDGNGTPQYLASTVYDSSTGKSTLTLTDLDDGTVVGTPHPVDGDTSDINILGTSSRGGVVVDGSGTAYVTTRLDNGDGTYTTKVTRIPGAVPSTSSFRMMTLSDGSATPPSALSVIYPEPEDTNPLVLDQIPSNTGDPAQFDMGSLLAV